MSKHTPGPWFATGLGVRDKGGYIAELNRPSRYPGQDERYKSELATREANAILIAAAPDLLEALETMVGQFASMQNLDYDEQLAVSDARAAIARAKGEQQC